MTIVAKKPEGEYVPATACNVRIDVRYNNEEEFNAEFLNIDPKIGPLLIEVIRSMRNSA